MTDAPNNRVDRTMLPSDDPSRTNNPAVRDYAAGTSYPTFNGEFRKAAQTRAGENLHPVAITDEGNGSSVRGSNKTASDSKEHSDGSFPWIAGLYDIGMNCADLYRRYKNDPEDFIGNTKPESRVASTSKAPELRGNALTSAFVEHMLNRLDTNHNQKLGPGELDAAITGMSGSTNEQAFIYALRTLGWSGLTARYPTASNSAPRFDPLVGNPLADNVLPKVIENTNRVNIPLGEALGYAREWTAQHSGSVNTDSLQNDFRRYEIDHRFHVPELLQMMQEHKYPVEVPASELGSTGITREDVNNLLSGQSKGTKAMLEKFAQNTGEDPLKAARYLHDNFDRFCSKPKTGTISIFDQGRLDARGDKVIAIQKAFEEGQRKLESIKRNSHAQTDGIIPLTDITPEAVRQGQVGDCYFLGALASFAKANPKAIQNMVRYDAASQTYKVRFPGCPDEEFSVKPPTPTERAIFAHSDDHSSWCSVIEAAYGQYCNQRPSRRGLGNLWSSNLPQDAADGGGDGGNAMFLLTGRHGQSISCEASIVEIEKALSAAKGKAISLERFGHIVAIVDYDPKTRMVTSYDQNATDDQQRQQKMSLEQLRQNARSLHISG